MVKGWCRNSALALVLAWAVWIAPGVQPASAQALPANFISSDVPHDVPAGPSATVAQLAVFAWQEFIALNWVALNPGQNNPRGRPDTSVGFLDIAPTNGSFPLVVWQTYRHKNELFPFNGQTDPNFDSATPSYSYRNQPTAAVGGPVPSFSLFNNLDETSQLGLDNMYAHSTAAVQPAAPAQATGIRVAYEAKVNRAVYNYVVQRGFTNPANNYQLLDAALANTGPVYYIGQPNSVASQFTGICSTTSMLSIVMLPCGDSTVAGDAGEGAIEIKSAWRQLTPAEASSGRFFMRNVIYYTGPQANQRYNNGVWGLVALHIIHKTRSFPAFVFATWEQVDNYVDGAANPNSQNLAYQNTGTPLANQPLTRVHAIHSQVAATNDLVHAAFIAGNPSTVWQYYKLIGVQATPENEPAAGASADDLAYYYLANIMVETNQPLQSFTGQIAGGVTANTNNVYLNGVAASPFQMGGCQGCHGFQAQYLGGDMSRLIAAAPQNSWTAESIDVSAANAIKTYWHRQRGVSVPKRAKEARDRGQ